VIKRPRGKERERANELTMLKTAYFFRTEKLPFGQGKDFKKEEGKM